MLWGRAPLPTTAQSGGWQEVVRVSTAAEWQRVSYDAYNWSCGVPFCPYTPTSGPNAFWWTPGYTLQGAWGNGYVWWDNNWPYWGYHPIPAIGKRAYRAQDSNQDSTVDLVRQQFVIPAGYQVTAAKIQVFSDNIGAFWLNGVRIDGAVGHLHWGEMELPASVVETLTAGTNLIAVAVHNREEMQGLQYVLLVELAPVVQLNVASPAGAALSRELGGVAYDTLLSWLVNLLRVFWRNASTYTAPPPEPAGRSYLGGYVRLRGDEQLLAAQSSVNHGGYLVADAGYAYCAWDTGTFDGGACTVILATPTPTNTPTPTPTATPTATPTNTPTPTPTPQPGSLSVDYPWLVWFAPQVGQPTQVIRGRNFQPGENVELRLTAPPDPDGDPACCAGQTVYLVRANASGEFVMSATSVGELYFGTQCKGGWQATGTGQSTGLHTNHVPWAVAWFPAHRNR